MTDVDGLSFPDLAMVELTQNQIEGFHRDGFVILERFLEPEAVLRARSRFERLFRGEFETGLYPDEWNWREGQNPADQTRQICNGWKADPVVASIVLHPDIGRLCATLAGWSGARIGQDNILWKPPGAKPLSFHQDDSYCQWVVPAGYVTVWIALDDTSAGGGTLEYARGSHRWGLFPMVKQFHAPENYRETLWAAARSIGVPPEIVPVEVPAGGCAIHAGRTWHGSDSNRSKAPRRALVAHCISAEARFHPTEISYIYNRYKRIDDDRMDESFFPVLWTSSGYRTPFLDRNNPRA